MKYLTFTTIAAAMIAAPAFAEGELNIFNWGNYTSPELIEKFEKTYDIKVTLTDYDSNETALSKIQAGGHGFDIVVPSNSHVPIWIEEGLILETRPDQMENFANVDPQWADVPWDPNRRYTVPWQWGSTGILVHTGEYSGDINSAAIVFDPPAELQGKINVVPEMQDVMSMAIMYFGGEQCTDDLEVLKKVAAGLQTAKAGWSGIDYAAMEKFVNEDLLASVFWNGASARVRADNAKFAYGYPATGYPVWMDSVAVLSDAKNVENAKLFQNFIMAPENAALISNFALYANGISGSEEFMDPTLLNSPEVVIPEDLKAAGAFTRLCDPATQELYTKIWTQLQK